MYGRSIAAHQLGKMSAVHSLLDRVSPARPSHCNHTHPSLIYRSPGGALTASNPHHLFPRKHSTRLHQSRPRLGRLHPPLGRHIRRCKKCAFPRQRLRLPLTAFHVGRRSHGRVSLQSSAHCEQGRIPRRCRSRHLHVRRLCLSDRRPPLHHARKIRIRHRLQRRTRPTATRNFLEKTSRALGIRRSALRSRRPLLPHRPHRRTRPPESRRHPHLRRRRTLRRTHHSRRRLHAAPFPRRPERPASRHMCRTRLGIDRVPRHNRLGSRALRRQQGTIHRHRHLRRLRHRRRLLHPALGAAIHHAKPRRHHLHARTRLRRHHLVSRNRRTPQHPLHHRRHLRPRRHPHRRTTRRPRRPRIPRTRLRRPHLFRNVVAPLTDPRSPVGSGRWESNCIPNFNVMHFDAVAARNRINWSEVESKALVRLRDRSGVIAKARRNRSIHEVLRAKYKYLNRRLSLVRVCTQDRNRWSPSKLGEPSATTSSSFLFSLASCHFFEIRAAF